MKRNFSVLLVLVLLSFQAWATFNLPSKPIKYKGVDITPAVKILSQYVKILKKDYTVFHWDMSGQEGQNEQMVLAAKKMANVFWTWYGRPETAQGGFYGNGLYLATDPISTEGFGGGNNWSLLQLILPKGMRIIDLGDNGIVLQKDEDAFNELKIIFAQLECSFADMNSFFNQGGAGLTSQCQGLVKKIFQETLKIDAFAYSYNQQKFKSCDSSSAFDQRAFVITNPQWINLNNVSFFSAKSRHAQLDRVRIQTLFLLNDETVLQNQLPFTTNDIQALKQYWIKHPQGIITDTNMVENNASSYRLVVRLCESSQNCEYITLESIYQKLVPFNPIITSQEAGSGDGRIKPRYYYNSNGQIQHLLWSDLEGQPKANDLSEWVKNNLFGCESASPFEEKVITHTIRYQNEK